MVKVLTEGAQLEYEQFLVVYADRGCSCHLNPPCGFCTHPGNPNNLNSDDNNFEEVPEAERKDKGYIVIKTDELKYIPFSLLQYFIKAVEAIQEGRAKDGKPRTNSYVVCNLDEPYASKIWDVILEGERDKVLAEKVRASDL